ncbi:hypothetical protein Hdeb2414_s0028g00704571 [Helianthus debilis subsp. tardiflorus]
MSELGGHCTSPPYQLKTVMIGILGSATRLRRPPSEVFRHNGEDLSGAFKTEGT